MPFSSVPGCRMCGAPCVSESRRCPKCADKFKVVQASRENLPSDLQPRTPGVIATDLPVFLRHLREESIAARSGAAFNPGELELMDRLWLGIRNVLIDVGRSDILAQAADVNPDEMWGPPPAKRLTLTAARDMEEGPLDGLETDNPTNDFRG